MDDRRSRAIHLLLVDGLNLIRRVYAAQPGEDGADRAEGARDAACRSLQRAVRESSPTHGVVVFEGPGPTWRHGLFPDYKAGHRPMPEALAAALPAYRHSFAELGLASFEVPATEADDVIATLAVKASSAGARVTILSTDRVFMQLVAPGIELRDHFRRRTLGRQDVIDRAGVPPEHWVDMMALAGDGGQGLRGVPGVGPKRAARAVAELGSLDAVLAAASLEQAGSGASGLPTGLAARLAAHAGTARLAASLFRLRTDLELGLVLHDLRLAGPA